MLQFVKQTVFQRSEIIKVFKDEIPQALWLLDEKTLFYVTLSGQLLWQESFEFRIMDVSVAADVILILTEKGRIHVRSRAGAKLHDLFLGDSVVVAMASSGGHFAVATEQAQLKFFATNAVASGQFYLEHAVDYLAFFWGLLRKNGLSAIAPPGRFAVCRFAWPLAAQDNAIKTRRRRCGF